MFILSGNYTSTPFHQSKTKSEEPSIQVTTEDQEQVLSEKLTPENYQPKFSTLLTCEQYAHVQELEKR